MLRICKICKWLDGVFLAFCGFQYLYFPAFRIILSY